MAPTSRSGATPRPRPGKPPSCSPAHAVRFAQIPRRVAGEPCVPSMARITNIRFRNASPALYVAGPGRVLRRRVPEINSNVIARDDHKSGGFYGLADAARGGGVRLHHRHGRLWAALRPRFL